LVEERSSEQEMGVEKHSVECELESMPVKLPEPVITKCPLLSIYVYIKSQDIQGVELVCAYSRSHATGPGTMPLSGSCSSLADPTR
jgi:hypothetical protein